jgi:hypothetical protein
MDWTGRAMQAEELQADQMDQFLENNTLMDQQQNTESEYTPVQIIHVVIE